MKRSLRAALIAVLTAVCLTTVVRADFGPKDALVVRVVNAPGETYYLDLLYRPKDGAVLHDNLTEAERAALNPAMIKRLRENPAGLTPVLAEGTSIPVFGSLTGQPAGGCMKHVFSYYGLPDTYRIIITTESGETRISEEYTRRALQSSITYDYATGRASVPPLWRQYLLQFAASCAATLVIEGAVLLLFRFSLRKNAAVFVLVNLATQVFLTAVMGRALILGGTLSARFTQIPCELAILIAEAAAYAFLLRGHSRARRIGCAVCANLASWGATYLLLAPLYREITSIA